LSLRAGPVTTENELNLTGLFVFPVGSRLADLNLSAADEFSLNETVRDVVNGK
jgi:hypothetical protein